MKIFPDQTHTDFTQNQLAIPSGQSGNRTKTSISDPVSPNVPWHPELDRRHSDSVNVVAKFAQKNSKNLVTDAPAQNHTYQNTNLTAGTLAQNSLFSKYS